MTAAVSDDLRERLVRLETEMKYATQKLDDMSAQMTALVSLMNQGKGAKWALAGMSGLVGLVSGSVGSVGAIVTLIKP